MTRSAALLSLWVLAGIEVGCAEAPSAPESLSATKSVVASNSVLVTNTAELLAALSSATNGTSVAMAPGEYELSSTLVVPDGTTLVGAGSMQLDPESNLPTGLDAATRTVLKATSTLTGEMVVLGDRTTLSGIAIEDAQRGGGSVVVASSRGAGDVVRTVLEDCEILSPNPDGGALDGPTGAALLAITRNRNLAAAPAPDVGAEVIVSMSHCIVRAPAGGAGIFAINFAGGGRLKLVLTQNVVAAGIRLVGGVARPDAVDDAAVVMDSRSNRFTAGVGASTLLGWRLYGGSTVPIAGLPTQTTTNNSVQVHSVDDLIQVFQTAISASGGLRLSAVAGEVSSNSVILDLFGTQLQSTEADLELRGTSASVQGTWTDFDNSVRVNARSVTGSGVRQNVYANARGPAATIFGAGNRLEIVGALAAFISTNSQILPPPPAQFFTAPD